ncbi:MAG: type IV secretory system conjugative DNA transfer family protein [Candidatus Dormibacteria bacterium]
MASALRLARELWQGLRSRRREVLGLVWLLAAAVSILAGGGPVADTPYPIFWVLLGALGWWLTRGWGQPRGGRLPSAPLRAEPPPRYRVLLGWDERGWLAAPPQVAALVLGPPRSGKTRGVIIPNVAAWPGPVLVTSTRRDVPDATAAWRGRRGVGWVFDPLGAVDPLPAGTHRLVWSPLRGCRTWDVARRRAESLAVDTGRGVEDRTHWRTRATQLVAVLLHAAACGDRDMATLRGWAHAQRSGPAEALCAAPGARAVLEGLLRTPERERGSIWSAAQGVLAAFDTASVCAAADARALLPFDPLDFLGGPHTVWVVAPSDAPTDGAPLVVGLVDEIREAARGWSDQLPEGALADPWLCALDEAATICPLPSLPRLLAEGGGRSIVTLVALQDLRQAAQRWGEGTAQSFLTLAGAKLVLPGLADAETLHTLEALVGRTWIPQETTSVSTGGRWGRDRTRSTTHGWVEQPELPASTWRSGPRGTARALVGPQQPVQVRLVDPDRTPPFSEWLRNDGRDRRPAAAVRSPASED